MMLSATIGVAASLLAIQAQSREGVPPAPENEKKICRNELQTSSRMPQRVCRTAAQWAEFAAQQEREQVLNRRRADPSNIN